MPSGRATPRRVPLDITRTDEGTDEGTAESTDRNTSASATGNTDESANQNTGEGTTGSTVVRASDAARRGPLSRRGFLQATATVTARADVGAPGVAAASGRTVLSFTTASGGSAALSPTGDRLVAEVQGVLWSVPRGGGTAVPVTAAGLEPTRPQFSPDDSPLVVCAYRGGGFHLWTPRPDGTGPRQLADGPWDDPGRRPVGRPGTTARGTTRGPAWSPHGTRSRSPPSAAPPRRRTGSRSAA
ncbi:hypothetical protein GCM10010254_18550 [Streptomyces chromofuscus]|nr:hypothetical protein GCM10010254_18550 [Streptomyces chromofuscus]